MKDTAPHPSGEAAVPGNIGGGAVLVFDGKGGVVVSKTSAEKKLTVPARGFSVIFGKAKAPKFKDWLKSELGPFNADLLVASSTRARCIVLEDRAMVVMRVARPGANSDDVGRQLMALWVEKNRVIIPSDLNVPEILGIAQWEQSRHAPVSPADLIARLALRAADRLEPQVEALGDRLDDIEQLLIEQHTAKTQGRLSKLRRTIINFRRLVWPQRDMLNTLEIEDLSFFTARDRQRLREASARVTHIGDELQGMSDHAVLIHELIIDARAEQMNRTILVLTAVTVVFMPLTLLTGALGMNLAGIPFAESTNSFLSACAGLLLIALGLVWWMRKKRWL